MIFVPIFAVLALLLTGCSMSAAILFFTSPLLKVLGTTGIIGGACLLVWFLAPAWLPINRSHLLWAGIALLGGGFFYWWAFHAGEEHMAQRIAVGDQEARARVEQAMSRPDACNDSGGTWDATVSGGYCHR